MVDGGGRHAIGWVPTPAGRQNLPTHRRDRNRFSNIPTLLVNRPVGATVPDVGKDPRAEPVFELLRADILAGRDRSQVATLPMHPGTLMLFQGRYSMHRVTPVSGEVPRLVLLLAYDTKPGTVSSERLQLSRYGRRAES